MTYEEVLAALADDTRRRIFEDLRSGPKNVTTLSDGRGVSRPAVSQHLKVLQEAQLVHVKQVGTSRYYSVDQQGLLSLQSYLESFWEDVLSAYEQATRETEGVGNDGADCKDGAG
ncbi:ArsR family transcriptional regulator [Rhodobacteraceae bacterium RKSG542]|uniref:ArsR/SmtB family transcription factor n=1 Tax=Pseudovibrio flavus TaxID=2529854 RepID=UPI0012BCEFFE|nr:metalloregulator ArsR/SmtB family transcription factor [Pseudovibrio flavus]MTI16247.1 ArsR family transcriptional regulator [Pseudovibrio flavus]